MIFECLLFLLRVFFIAFWGKSCNVTEEPAEYFHLENFTERINRMTSMCMVFSVKNQKELLVRRDVQASVYEKADKVEGVSEDEDEERFLGKARIAEVLDEFSQKVRERLKNHKRGP